jgi:hypothetical protein
MPAPAGPPAAAPHALWNRWIDLWNGDLPAADEVLADRVTVHSPPLSKSVDPSAVQDRAGALALIGGVRSIADLRFTTELGPLTDGCFVTGCWRFSGPYLGGLPESAARPGTLLENRGIDILRLEGGRVREWWSAAENIGLLTALGLIHAD